MFQPELGRMRISDEERESVVEQLRHAFEVGRLNLEEFDRRARALYEIQTYAEAWHLLEDLPVENLPVFPAQQPMQDDQRGQIAQPRAQSKKPSYDIGSIALVMGVLSFASLLPFTILAIVLGLIGLDRVRTGKSESRKSALAGLVLGSASVPFWILFFVIGAANWW